MSNRFGAWRGSGSTRAKLAQAPRAWQACSGRHNETARRDRAHWYRSAERSRSPRAGECIQFAVVCEALVYDSGREHAIRKGGPDHDATAFTAHLLADFHQDRRLEL